MSKTALEGVRVLEYCHTMAGAYCARQLADLGAEVVKIEKPLVGDEARRTGPFPGDAEDPEKSGLFLYLNTSKLGITLDPATAGGGRIFAQLAAKSDVVIEDNPPGFMESIGLGYRELSELKRDLIVTSITPFGQVGPYSGYRACGLNVYHGSGLGHITPEGHGDLDQPPLRQGKYAVEYACGIGAALVTLGALLNGEMTGQGQLIDFSMQEWEMNLLKPKWTMYTYEGFAPNRKTVVRQGHRMLPCKDGHFILLMLEEHQWIGLTELVDRPEWLVDERFSEAYARAENGSELNRLISEWAKDHTMREIYHRGQELGVPVGMVNSPGDIFSSPQLAEREFLVEIEHPVAGNLTYPGTPYRMSETRCGAKSSAPTLGQNNDDIYVKLLGFRPEDLAMLRCEGAI